MVALLCKGGGSLLLSSDLSRRTIPTSAIPSSPLQLCHPHRARGSFHLLCACAPFQVSEQLVAVSQPSPSTPDAVISPADPVRQAAGALDIRVGRVLRAWRHPGVNSLYVAEVDVGETKPRTICIGLVNNVPLDVLQGKDVIVLANWKYRNMLGFNSNGVLLAASDALHENVELLVPPVGSVLGERLWFGSEEDCNMLVEAATSSQVRKKRMWAKVQPLLKTTENCEVSLLGIYRMRTSAGLVSCGSLKNAHIS